VHELVLSGPPVQTYPFLAVGNSARSAEISIEQYDAAMVIIHFLGAPQFFERGLSVFNIDLPLDRSGSQCADEYVPIVE